MRDDEIRSLLSSVNPWWAATAARRDPTAWQSSHPVLRRRDALDLGYRADVLDDVARGPVTDRLVVLTGPRRIGKSVVLLDAAASLCGRDDVDPRQVVHVPCDGMRDRDLRRVLVLARAMTTSVDAPSPRPRVWLLDEVSGVAGWTAVLKLARDTTALADDTVVATGSRWRTAHDVVGNLLAGRAGTTPGRRLRHLLPMSFRDYVTTTRPGLPLPPTSHPAHLQSPGVAADLATLAVIVDDYDLAWQDYLTSGGFPRAVTEHSRDGQVSTEYYADVSAWLTGDIDPDATPDSIPLLLSTLESRSGSPLNVTATASDLNYGSRSRLTARLDRVVSSFVGLWCPQRDASGTPVSGSQAKLYLTDPLLAWLPSRTRSGLPAPDMTRSSEAALAIALARTVDDLDEGRWVAGDTVGYARTSSGAEVDLVPVSVPAPSGPQPTAPLESKWVGTAWRRESRVLETRYGRGIVATKQVLDTSGPVWAVPAPLVAALL